MPGIIKIRKRMVTGLRWLEALALKKIFEPENMNYIEEKVFEESYDSWLKKVDKTPEEIKELKFITACLLADIDGHYTWQKEFFKLHNIDYKKVYSCGLSK